MNVDCTRQRSSRRSAVSAWNLRITTTVPPDMKLNAVCTMVSAGRGWRSACVRPYRSRHWVLSGTAAL
jgi:hypothetical protein